mmetsp:Transcript_7496/g.16148  ORF Transcript_7496/g.16148 Transcript_7496/m.16148 type:complete len:559 (-) Transcript_7496:196-1872(-)|eukprot:CAMPEP_0168163266 /NCGR_PEP_ID=MMETSP0139_2-20121125/281_1 /TAXON_ID=44445 /ORGANISM="Pseudo-nitzschia australis, Strain 10249 10 AB" /LENGTH=558 /DNA_ID=CAMNT_0008080143 /DNA_START=83 /DNA_END=1759 /DNA_ORIENTATION=+
MSTGTDNPIIAESGTDDFLSRIKFRKASPTDISRCVEMVKKEPKSSGLMFVSKNELEYRQHHAANYYRCAVCEDEDHENDEDKIIGFITGIRLGVVEEDGNAVGHALTNIVGHDPNGKVLVIRSVIVGEEYRKKGVGKAMIKDYIEAIRQIPKQTSLKSPKKKPVMKIVGLSWDQALSSFYLGCGFSVQQACNVAGACTEIEKRDALQRAYFFELSLASPCDYGVFGDSNNDDEVSCCIVDSFASVPGTGNPAAVVLLREDFDPVVKHKWMQKVAAEFNLAETAFCWPKGSNTDNDHADAIAFFKNESHWNIRYFTPTIEMGLCGHATLASAAVLYQTLPSEVLPSGTAVVFHASEDILTMNLANDETKGSVSSSQRVSKVSMNFPPKPTEEISTREEKATVRNMLKSAFSIDLEPLYVGLSDIGDLLVELSPKAFGEIGYDSLNFKALFEWDGYYRGIVICCVSPESESNENKKTDASLKIDFLSRFFAPKAGIDEDPVTGSAHCSLGPYFAKRLQKNKVVGRQMSIRSGIVECEVAPDRVLLTGTAITTMSGKLFM